MDICRQIYTVNDRITGDLFGDNDTERLNNYLVEEGYQFIDAIEKY